MSAEKGKTKERCRVTFLGHASALITMNGINIIADPIFSRHVFFFVWRRGGVPMKVEELPPIDLILISHGHYDHLDLPTIRKLPREIPVITPPGLRTVLKWARRKRVVTLREWESHHADEVTVTAVPAKHFHGRPPLFPVSRFQGYIVEGDATVYFAGDSGIFDGLSEIGRKWDIDVALLPIGAYSPRSFRRHHMSPEDAVEAGRMLGAKVVVPIHWGAFKLSLEPLDEPVPRLERAARKARCSSMVKVLAPGRSVSIRSGDSGRTIEVLPAHAGAAGA